MDPTSSKADNKKRTATPKNTAIYVSGLPEDISMDELVPHFSKCGIIMDEILTGKPRVKLYNDEEGKLKGDALIVYLREESVNLALSILDESEIRPGVRIKVQEASFNRNNSDDPLQAQQNESKRTKVDKETWKKHMKRMQKKLEWFDEEGEAQAREAARLARFSKILVLRNMYRPEELQQDPLEFPIQLSDEIREECEEKLGIAECSVQVVEDKAEEGICTVKFKTEIEAQMAAKLMNGRLFAGLRVSATIYDGSFPLPKKQHRISKTEDEDEKQARLDAFSQFIENADIEESEKEDSSEPDSDESIDSDSSEVDQ